MTRTSLALACLVLAAFAARAEQDPRLLDEFTSTNDAGKAVFTREAGGFRLNAPGPVPFLGGEMSNPTLPSLWLLETTYAVAGDFEYAVDFDVRQLGPKGKPMPTEANAEISTSARGPHGYLGVNVNAMPDAPKCFRVVRSQPKLGGWHFNITTYPRKSDVGRIALRRKGAEMSLLAADGPAEPLVELVRYPHDPRSSPNLRMSAYQGNQPTRMAVNVLFGNVTVRADRLVRGPEAGASQPRVPPRATYPVTIDYSRKPGSILTDFNHSNDSGKAFRPEGEGLRVKPPTIPQHKAGVNAYWYRDSKYSLSGDFEVAVRFDVTKLGPVGKESGYRSASVSIGLQTEGPIGSVNFSRGLSDVGHRYSITRYSPTKAGPTWDTMTFPTKSDKGRLVLRRAGAELTFLVEEETVYAELLRTPWVTGPVPRLRINADQGGTAVTPVNVLLTDFTVKAEGLLDADKGTPLTPVVARPDSAALARGDVTVAGGSPNDEALVLDAAPVVKSNKWRNLQRGFGALVALLATGGAVAAWLRQRRAKAA